MILSAFFCLSTMKFFLLRPDRSRQFLYTSSVIISLEFVFFITAWKSARICFLCRSSSPNLFVFRVVSEFRDLQQRVAPFYHDFCHGSQRVAPFYLGTLTTTTDRTTGLLFRVIDSSSVRVEKRLTDYGVVEVQVFSEPLLGHGLLIELDVSLCEEEVVGLITCGGEVVVIGPISSAVVRRAFVYLTSGKVKSRRKCWKPKMMKRRKMKQMERSKRETLNMWWPWDGIRDKREHLEWQ